MLRVLPFDPQWNFTSILMSGFFFQLFFKIFFRSIQKYLITFLVNFWKSDKISWISLRFSIVTIGNLKEIHEILLDFRKFPQNLIKYFWIDRFFFGKVENVFGKVEKISNINIEEKYHCGSNGSTLSLWKSL